MDWLDPVRGAVARARGPVWFFFRDDDVGWDDARLLVLLDLFQARAVPIDLAVIPHSLTIALARALRTRRARTPDLLSMHQHGLAHVNHERQGRRSEFGPTRSRDSQRDDLACGRATLERLLGWTDSIFTPPWNRCSQDTVLALGDLGFQLLSRDAGAQTVHLGALRELSVVVDWCKGAPEIESRRDSLAQRAADAVACGRPVGIMLHHAVMPAADLEHLDALLAALRGLPHARLALMRAAASACTRAAVASDWSATPR